MADGSGLADTGRSPDEGRDTGGGCVVEVRGKGHGRAPVRMVRLDDRLAERRNGAEWARNGPACGQEVRPWFPVRAHHSGTLPSRAGCRAPVGATRDAAVTYMTIVT